MAAAAATALHLGPSFGPSFGIVNITVLASWLFYIIVMLSVVYTLIAAYHWVRYGHHSVATIPALSIHIAVSLGLIGYALTGLP